LDGSVVLTLRALQAADDEVPRRIGLRATSVKIAIGPASFPRKPDAVIDRRARNLLRILLLSEAGSRGANANDQQRSQHGKIKSHDESPLATLSTSSAIS
jgi:hypothetical protein